MTLRSAIACLVLAAAVGGCATDHAAPSDPGGEARRRRLTRFWELYDDATEARTRRELGEAAELYEQALALEPAHEDCLYYLGHCRRELGQHEVARRALAALVGGNPHSFRGHMALGAHLASPEEGGFWDLAAAERHLRAAHAVNGEETGALVRLAEVLLVRGDVEGARASAEAAARSNPRCAEARILSGFVARESGDEASATAAAREAFRVLHPEPPPAGVAGEGDRKAEGGKPAPPLASTMGRLLFAGTYDALKAAPAEPEPAVVYAELGRRLEALRSRGATPAPPAAVASAH